MLLDPLDQIDARPGRPCPLAVVAFAALAAGLALGRYVEGPPAAAWFAGACGALALAGAAAGRSCRAALLVAMVLFGAGWFTLRLHEPARDGLGRLAAGVPSPGGRMLVTLEGTVLDTPREHEDPRDPLTPRVLDEPRLRFDLAVEVARTADGPRGLHGIVWVRTPLLERDPPRAGDRLRLTGLLRPIPPPMNPGEPDRRLWAAQAGVAGTLGVPDAALVERLGPAESALARAWASLLRWRAAAGDRARELLLGQAAAPPEPRALLGALLLGEEEPDLREVRSAFTRLGLAHALAISGFHMTVMASVALFAVRLTGDRGWLEPAIVAALVAAYLAILPVSAPVWRSGLMVLALLAAEACGRRYDRLALLGWIAVALLLWRPMDLWSLGFQLSFGLVAALIGLGPRAHAAIWGTPIRTDRWVLEPTLRWIAVERTKQFFSANVLCCAVAAPLVAYHTGLASLLAVLTGFVVVALVSLLLYGGYAAVLLGALVPALGPAAGAALGWLAEANVRVVRWLDTIPGTWVRLPPVSLAWTAAATALLVYWFAWGHRRDRPAWALSVLVAAWLGVECWLGPRLPNSTALRLDTLAVGDGSCHLIRAGGDAVLWDCGSLTPGVGRWTVPRAARALGAWRVPTVIVSHPDLDHFNGLVDAAEPLGVRTLLVGEAFMDEADVRPEGPEAFLLARLRERGVEVRTIAAGEALPIGAATMTFLAPPAGGGGAASNDRSLVALVEAPTDGGIRRLLMTGDIERGAMGYLAAAWPGLRAHAMEAPHHGSARPGAPEFVARIGPGVVVQSTGPRRAGDARWDGVRARTRWWTTATDGAAWVRFGRDGSVESGALRAE